MPSTKGKILRLLSGMLLRRATVASAERVGGFCRLTLRGPVPPFRGGMRVQVLLASDDTRTYTPIASTEGMMLLGWQAAGGPGARWLGRVAAGDEVSFLGPQRSLELEPGRLVLVGDETSVGLAASFEAERPGQVRAIIQADGGDGTRAAAASAGLAEVEVVARGDHAAAAEAAIAQLAAAPAACVALTGGSDLVVAVRRILRAAGVGNIKTKPYWVPGKTGLD